MRAKDIMSESVASISSSATILEAAALFVNTQAGAMPVIDDHDVMIGIVTEADVIPFAGLARPDDKAEPSQQPREGDARADPFQVARVRRVTDVMTKTVISVDANASLKEVVVLMAAKRLKHLPVRGDKGIVGMVSRLDLLRVIISLGGAADASGSGAPLTRDEALRAEVRKALGKHSQLLHSHISIVVNDGAVHLWGNLPDDATYKIYHDAAAGVPGVKSIESHIHIVRRPARGGA